MTGGTTHAEDTAEGSLVEDNHPGVDIAASVVVLRMLAEVVGGTIGRTSRVINAVFNTGKPSTSSHSRSHPAVEGLRSILGSTWCVCLWTVRRFV